MPAVFKRTVLPAIVVLLAHTPVLAEFQWASIGPDNQSPYDVRITAIVIDPVDPSTLYVGTEQDYVYKSTDRGRTWVQQGAGSGLNNNDIYALAMDPLDPQTLYAGGLHYAAAVSKTSDGGNTWTPTGLNDKWVTALVIDPNDRNILYAGVNNVSVNGDDTVYKSTNGGASWTGTNLRFTNSHVYALAMNSLGALYAGTSGSYLYRTTDGGLNWVQLQQGLGTNFVFTIAVDRVDPNTVYVGTYVGVFRSLDGGASWHPMNSGIPSSGNNVRAIAIDPKDSRTIYAVTDEVVYRSTNGGESWTAIGSDWLGGEVSTIAIDPRATGTLYVGGDKGVFKGMSADGAVLWGDAKGKDDRDCFIGLAGYSGDDDVWQPINQKGTKFGVVCTEGDPACDLDGAQNGVCEFAIGLFLQKSGHPTCDPESLTFKKVKAKAKAKGVKINLVTELGVPGGEPGFVSDLVPFKVSLKGKKNKTGKGRVTLSVKKPTDKDTFQFRCKPGAVQ